MKQPETSGDLCRIHPRFHGWILKKLREVHIEPTFDILLLLHMSYTRGGSDSLDQFMERIWVTSEAKAEKLLKKKG